MTFADKSLTGYGHPIHVRCNFMCVYCGFDGRPFPNWLQLTVDHVVPTSSGGSDDDDNKVTACHVCNSITSLMPFPPGTTREQAMATKLARVRERQKWFFGFWKERVAPNYLAHWRDEEAHIGCSDPLPAADAQPSADPRRPS